jgi:L-serine dehydratase
VPFKRATHLVFHMAESLPEHPNGMRFTLTRKDGSTVSKVYYSVGGGFIREEGEAPAAAAEASPCLTRSTPWTNCWRMACAAA